MELQDLFSQNEPAITKFRGEYRWLSNFWPAPFITQTGEYPSVEHYYQAWKSTDFEVHKTICKLKTASEAKKFGKRMAVRPDFHAIKNEIMYYGVKEKFAQNPELEAKLLDTGNRELVEGNAWGDFYWGACGGEGQNMLGKILMLVRAECGLARIKFSMLRVNHTPLNISFSPLDKTTPR